MTEDEIEALKKKSNTAYRQIWMSSRELVLEFKARNPEKSSKYATTTWLRTTGKGVTRLLPEPLSPELKKKQKYLRRQVMELLNNPPPVRAELQEWQRRTAEADASGEWVPLGGVQDRLLGCNEKFANIARVSGFLSNVQKGRNIRRLYDGEKEEVPPSVLCLQRYYLPDVLKVAETYQTRVQESRFIIVDEPPEHTWLSFPTICRLTGCPRQRLVDLATRGHIQAVMIRKTFDAKRGAKTRLSCYADFAAVREVLCWRSHSYVARVMGRDWLKKRLEWQEKYGLVPPFDHVAETYSAAGYSVYCPELINETASYTKHVH